MKRFLASALTAAMLFTGVEGLARRRAVGPPPYGPSHVLPTMSALDDLVMTNHLPNDVPAKVCVDDVCDTYKLAAGETRTIPDLIQSKGKQSGIVVLNTNDNVEARASSGSALRMADAAPVTVVYGVGTRYPNQLLIYSSTPSPVHIDLINYSGTRVGGKTFAHPGGALLLNPAEIPGHADEVYLKITGAPHVATQLTDLPRTPTVRSIYPTHAQDVSKATRITYTDRTSFIAFINSGFSDLQLNITQLPENKVAQLVLQPQAMNYIRPEYGVQKVQGNIPSLVWRDGQQPSTRITDEHEASFNMRDGYMVIMSETSQPVRLTRKDATGKILETQQRDIPADTRTVFYVNTTRNGPGAHLTISGNVYVMASANDETGTNTPHLPYVIRKTNNSQATPYNTK